MQYPNPFGQNPMSMARTGAAAAQVDIGLRKFMLGIYNYMAAGLALTGIVALMASQSEAFLSALYVIEDGRVAGMKPLAWLAMFAPLGMALLMGFGINRMSASTAQALFWAFAGVMGLSLSTVFLTFTGESVARVFFITAGAFAGLSLYGYTTKRDLTGMGSFLMMGLIGLVIASVVNLFLKSSGLHFALSLIGVGIFAGLTAYDTQKLKVMYYQVAGNAEAAAKMSVIGALNLYMDFINLFIHLLQFMGERR